MSFQKVAIHYFLQFRFAMEILKLYIYSTTCFLKHKDEGVEGLNFIMVLFDVPKLICNGLLCVKFIYVLVKTIQQRREKKKKGVVSYQHSKPSLRLLLYSVRPSTFGL